MAARSTRITVRNQTGAHLRHVSDSLDHGEWTDPLTPPQEIPPGATMWWQSESDGIATGTEGRATYDIVDGTGWRPWFQIHPETVFDHAAQQVTALARNDHHVDLFTIGFDNAIWSTWWEPDDTGWR